ncbi:hypothetical protein [Pseudooceanicola antarcticus]|uniref:hypothetical protein n=1 Tax=Pseudooceanicola antarcticus TaxID=1247613 RepID=UPI0012FD5121|nr:hypothetical protein [Pseudooceanicola antarcticus]
MRRLFLVLGLALLCIAPIVGAMTKSSDLSAEPMSADTSELVSPLESDQAEP